MYKLAVFDLDGTLLDTIEDLAIAGNYALRLGGFSEHPVEAYKLFVGNGIHNLILRCLPENSRDDETVAQVKANFNRYYKDHARDMTAPYDRIPEALGALKKAGVNMAVLSNKPDIYAGELVKQYFPGLVTLTYGQREGVPIKPDPTALFEIMAYFGYNADQCAYIGDTGVDMNTGKGAGLFTIGVSWGFRTKDELSSQGADVIIDKPEQLTRIIVDN